MLAAQYRENDLIDIRTSSEVVGRSVRVHLAKGSVTGAALIGADGLWSNVRKQVVGDGPPRRRATGVSWANAVGRIGSVPGSMAGGLMLSADLALPAVFVIVALPAFVAGASILAMGVVRARGLRLQLQA